MRKSLIVGAILALIGSSALAQAPPAQQQPGNRAINTEGTNNSSAPVMALTALPKVKPNPASKPVVIRMSPS
jgi:hypothetical protein